MIWRPNVTVASVIEDDGRFLMVEERAGTQTVYNQPAGHLEDGETLFQAAIRETLEETARVFTPEGLVGVYRWKHPHQGTTFLRFTFFGGIGEAVPGRALDPDIIDTHWLSAEQLRAEPHRLRSPLVLQSLEDYLAGRRYPLDLLVDG